MNSLHLQQLAAAHHGLIPVHDVLAAGGEYRDLKRLIQHGELAQVRHGYLVDGAHWEGLDVWVGRPRLRALAASLAMRKDHVLSHDSAAHLQGIEFLAPAKPYVHITRRDVHGSRHECGVKHHGAPYRDQQVRHDLEVPALGAARTAVDIAREHGLLAGVSALDSALRRGSTHADFQNTIESMRHWPGVRNARLAIGHADPGAENPGESKARMAVICAGLVDVRTQFPIALPHGLAWADMLAGRQVVEFDGQLKYVSTPTNRVDVDHVIRLERRRERELMQWGLGVTRLTWEDLSDANWDASVTRIAREADLTRQRLGADTPPDLLEAARRLEPKRQARLFRGSSPGAA